MPSFLLAPSSPHCARTRCPGLCSPQGLWRAARASLRWPLPTVTPAPETPPALRGQPGTSRSRLEEMEVNETHVHVVLVAT